MAVIDAMLVVNSLASTAAALTRLVRAASMFCLFWMRAASSSFFLSISVLHAVRCTLSVNGRGRVIDVSSEVPSLHTGELDSRSHQASTEPDRDKTTGSLLTTSADLSSLAEGGKGTGPKSANDDGDA